MGLNFISVHLHRVIEAHVLNVIYITGPGHGGPGLAALAPRGERRMGANPHANGGYLRDIMQLNRETRNFRGTYHRLR